MTINLKSHFERAQRYTAGSVATAMISGIIAPAIMREITTPSLASITAGFAVACAGAYAAWKLGKKANAIRDEAVATFQPAAPTDQPVAQQPR